MTSDYYLNLCQRKIRKTEKRIELCKKHLDPTKDSKNTVERNLIRINKKEGILASWNKKYEERAAYLKKQDA